MLQGEFKANSVQGLSYISGSESGVTGLEGGFEYIDGGTVTFSVGGLTLGSGDGKAIMTPLDLVTLSTTSTIEVSNRMRLLMILDEDTDPINGIKIGLALTTPSQGWGVVDFSSGSFATDISAIISDINEAYATTVTLPSIAEANNYMEYAYGCLSSGVYVGGYTGGSSGTSIVWVDSILEDLALLGTADPVMGVVYGAFFDGINPGGVWSDIGQGLGFDASNTILVNGSGGFLQLAGSLNNYADITGSWSDTDSGFSGTYTASRLAGSADAVFRISGYFNLDAEILPLAFDVMPNSSVVGQLSTPQGLISDLTGSLSGDSIALSGDGYSFSIDFDRDGTDTSNDSTLGDMPGATGTVTFGAQSGSVFGTSCVVNYDQPLVGAGFLPPIVP